MIRMLDVSAPTGTFRVRLREGEMRIGRASDCDIFVRDKLASARHAVITLTVDGAVRIRDLGSTNGIYVNGVRRAEAPLRPGDSVRLGGTILAYVEEAADEEGVATTAMSVVEEKADQTGYDPFSITVGADEIAADLGSKPGTPGTASAALLVARTRLALLYRLGQGAHVGQELEEVLTHIAQVVREGVGPERIAILVSEREGEPAVRRFARDWRKAGDHQAVYVPRLVVATAMYQRKVVLYHNLLADPRFMDEPRLREVPVRQAMAAPIHFGGSVRGAVYVDRATAEPPFTAEELYLLGIVAHLSGVSLQNHELFQRERKTLDDLKRAQAELVRAAKLTTIGELLSSIANEINNPIAAIVGCAELAASAPECPQQVRDDVDEIRRAASRVRTIVEQILGFCRKSGQATGTFSVDKGLRQSLEAKARELSSRGIKLDLDFLPGIPPVSGDPSQLQHAILHIVHSCERAIESRERGGRIAARARCDHERCRITIEDDGPPIPAEALPHVFEATYAGRARGRPGGMGLSITHAIVEHHGGSLTVTSDGVKGARFTVDLPLKRGASVEMDQTGAIAAPGKDEMAAAARAHGAPAAPSAPAAPAAVGTDSDRFLDAVGAESGPAVAVGAAAPVEAPAAATGRRRRILICDDEEAVLDIMARRLEKDGLEVVLAASGEQALERLAQERDISFVVTDVHLGGMDGLALADRAAALHPSLSGRFLFVTGDTTSPVVKKLADRNADVLAKPFSLGEFSARVAAAIAAANVRIPGGRS
jgi:signal transduction histidine kinase/CheY-like chemotaxis protein